MGNDDRRLESYLRQFRPARPEPLPVAASWLGRVRRRRRFAWTAMAAAGLITAGTWLSVDHKSRPQNPKISVIADEGRASQPLTIGRANTMLFESRSVADALNRMAFSRKPKIPAGKRSALGVLSEEKLKL